MADGNSGQAVRWHVTRQTETVQPSPGAPLSKGFNVYFVTDNGLDGSVFVPEAQYSETQVQKLIGDKVAAMTKVAGLTGSV